MEHLWILFIFIYAFLKGSREGLKKSALKKSSANEILFFYTLIGLILVLPFSGTAFELEPFYIFLVFIKSAVVCTAWLFSFVALKSMTVSLYGIMDPSRMVFSTLMGVFLLNEVLTAQKVIGMALVVTGLIMVNLKKTASSKPLTFTVLCAALANCFFNAVSGTMDKVLMQYMNSSQLQFWFMLFMTLIYGAILIIKKEKISVKSVKTNYMIPLMSISLILGDRLLFEANRSPLSQITLMTVIKQSAVIVTVLMGYFVFKEKENFLYKLMCTVIVLSGIFTALL